MPHIAETEEEDEDLLPFAELLAPRDPGEELPQYTLNGFAPQDDSQQQDKDWPDEPRDRPAIESEEDHCDDSDDEALAEMMAAAEADETEEATSSANGRGAGGHAAGSARAGDPGESDRRKGVFRAQDAEKVREAGLDMSEVLKLCGEPPACPCLLLAPLLLPAPTCPSCSSCPSSLCPLLCLALYPAPAPAKLLPPLCPPANHDHCR